MSTTHIDSDFVLNARKFSDCKKTWSLTNSQMTTTTHDLSYNRLRSYSPVRYSTSAFRTITSPTLASEIRRSLSPTELKRALDDTAHQSRSRSRERRFKILNNRLQRSRSTSPIRRASPYTEGSLNGYKQTWLPNSDYEEDPGSSRISDASFKEKMYRESSDLATWATHPVHLMTSSDPAELRNNVRLSRSRSRRLRTPSPNRLRSRSSSATELRSLRSSRATSPTRLYEDFPLTGKESLAKDHFPVTMSAYKIEHKEPPLSRSMMTSPPPKHLRPKSESKWRVDGKISSTKGLNFPFGSTRTTREDEITKMYTMTEAAPSLAASTIHMVSPYASDLSSLRLERLKIEEEHLLEMKRLAEIERLRGPKPKWYELKTPDFHYEVHKNNELLESKEKWKSLVDYRSV